MYTFFLMIKDLIHGGPMHWYVLFIAFILVRWAVVRWYAHKYRPYHADGTEKLFTSVIIPVVDEPLDLFRRVLSRILEQGPNEIVIVVNGPESPGLVEACRELRRTARKGARGVTTQVKVMDSRIAGKRNAVKLGVRSCDPASDVAILVDSDSIWVEGTLEHLLEPFVADPQIGGVTTRQKIYKPNRTLPTMVAGLLEEIRAEGTMKAMSVTGKVGCLPGRTIAFRTPLLREEMDEFMTETFMGIHKEVSDDRSLTNLTLRRGFKTVMQDTSVVYTDAPTAWPKFLRQQLRWAEGSQYNNIRMSKWMWGHAKLMLFIYASDMLLPFLLISTYTTTALTFVARLLGYHIVSVTYSEPVWMVVLLILLGAALGMGTRNFRALTQLPPVYLALLPVLTLVLSFIMAPLRIVGLMRCADGLAWGTRVIATS